MTGEMTALAEHSPGSGRRRRAFGALVTVLVVALLAGAAWRSSVVSDYLATRDARRDAEAAIAALREGDLAALDAQLERHRADPAFAHYFTRQATPRDLGDALATVADLDLNAPVDEDSATGDLDADSYERTLVDLADVLALATQGTNELTLPTSWTEDFATYLTDPGSVSEKASPDSQTRASQDQANRQNLLLLLSRGRWSTDFLQVMTEAFWDSDLAFESDGGLDGDPWPGAVIEGAKYAPAPSGAYLTDGTVALMAALTANPEAAGWAFTDLQPDKVNVEFDDDEHPMGAFAHYLFFEHRYDTSAESGAEDLGVTVSVMALMSAIQATGGSYGDSAVGPMADLFVLQDHVAYIEAQADQKWYEKFDDWAGAAWDSVGAIAHLALDAAGFIPVVGEAADGISATWSAIEGDWAGAGLSAAAMIPFAGAAAGAAKVAKNGTKTIRLVDRVGGTINESSDAGKLLTKATGVGDGIFDFDNADDFLDALNHPVPGVTYKYGDTTYELAPDGKTLTHLSGPDKEVIARGGRNEKGQIVSGTLARADAAAKEAQGLKDYEATTGLSVVRDPDGTAVQALSHVNGLQSGRFFDGLAKKPDGTYEGVEVKSGGATRSANQQAFDDLVSSESPATATLPDGTLIRITSVAPLVQVP